MEPENLRIDFLSQTMCHDETSFSRRYRANPRLRNALLQIHQHCSTQSRHSRKTLARIFHVRLQLLSTYVDAYAHSAFPRSRLIDSPVVGGLESRGSFHARALHPFAFLLCSRFASSCPGKSTRLNRVPVSR